MPTPTKRARALNFLKLQNSGGRACFYGPHGDAPPILHPITLHFCTSWPSSTDIGRWSAKLLPTPPCCLASAAVVSCTNLGCLQKPRFVEQLSRWIVRINAKFAIAHTVMFAHSPAYSAAQVFVGNATSVKTARPLFVPSASPRKIVGCAILTHAIKTVTGAETIF